MTNAVLPSHCCQHEMVSYSFYYCRKTFGVMENYSVFISAQHLLLSIRLLIHTRRG